MNVGGAQRQVIELAKALDNSGTETTVITFYDGGPLRSEVAAIPGPIALLSAGKQGRWDLFPFFYRLWRQVHAVQPNIIYSLLPFPNIVAALLKPLLPNVRVVWGVRACTVGQETGHWSRFLSIAERTLVKKADLVIANSNAAKEAYASYGFQAEKILVIPNGFDTDRFRPDPTGRREVRAEWGIGEEEILIGLAGRLDPYKGHPTFLKAASLLCKARSDVRFVCVGDGETGYRRQLFSLSESLGVRDRVIWAGSRVDMPAVYSAFDIATVCSRTESFCNVLGEAMSCGLPCVATRVGDSAHIVGDTWPLIRTQDPQALAETWTYLIQVLRQSGQTINQRGRERIVKEFSASTLAQRTIAALDELLRSGSR